LCLINYQAMKTHRVLNRLTRFEGAWGSGIISFVHS